MRKELKFLINKGDIEILYLNLIQYGFKVLYPSRYVYSIYYDTESFSLFNLSEYGLSSRNKVRIRLYNHNVQDAFIEYKHKIDESGTKTRQSILKFKNLIEISSNKFEKFKIPEKINEDLMPNIGVCYFRNYLLSECGDIRITIDRDLIFGNALKINKKIYLDFNTHYPEQILELKFNISSQAQSSSLEKIINHFNLTLTKFSKYCTGIKILY